MKFCSQCGAKNSTEAKFCENCGNSFSQQQASLAGQPQSTPAMDTAISANPLQFARTLSVCMRLITVLSLVAAFLPLI